MMLAAAGAVAGLGGALWLTKACRAWSSPVVLVAVALLACYLPARRAMRVDPVVALRCE